jgi:hypothetical protein
MVVYCPLSRCGRCISYGLFVRLCMRFDTHVDTSRPSHTYVPLRRAVGMLFVTPSHYLQ